MKKIVTALAAITFAGAAGVAQAVDISQAPQTIDLSSGSNMFSRVFSGMNDGNTFTDRYNFTATANSSLSSYVTSLIMPPATKGLSFTDFTLYNSGGPLQTGTKVFEGPLNLWTNAATHLQAANYYLLVSGSVAGNESVRYDGAIHIQQVAAVPEPETYGMLLGGLAILGVVARHRKTSNRAT